MEYHSGGSLPLLGRPRYCPGVNANGGYLCETGHCCGETGCCTYYYELWWFWLLWTVLILFSCCCAYRHRRAKLRVQQQQRQREISLLAYHGARSYPSSMLDLSFLASLKLPSYEEVAAQPSTPPPPYSSVFTTPRYPQPPRCSDPHLLTQHCALLHQPLSDGPSSLSSDNSSSCSCDSCCPSSPCSSSLSAPVTYETDTSHATTPSEATPLTLDVTIETIAAAARCLEVNETQFVSERMAANDISDEYAAEAQETICAVDSSAPKQIGAVAVVTRAVSPHPLSSPGSEVDLPVVPPNKQLDSVTCAPTVSTCSPSTVEATLPSIQDIDTEGPANCLETAPTLKITSKSDPSAPTASNCDNHTTTHTLNLTRTFDSTSVPSSPTSVPSPDVGRTLALMTGSADLPTRDSNPTLVPIPAPSNLIQQSNPVTTNPTQSLVTVPTDLTPSPETVPINFTQAPDPVPSNLTQVLDLTRVPNSQLKSTTVPDCASDPIITQKPAHTDLTLGTDAAPTSTALTHSQITDQSPGLGPIPGPTSPRSGMAQHSLVSCLDPPVPVNSGPSLVLSQSSDVQVGLSSGSGSGSSSSLGFTSGQLSGPAPVHAFPTPAAPSPSCPAITIESESSFPLTQSPPSALSPSSPPSLPSPPSPSLPELSSFSLPGPPLLLDPLNALHQSKKGGSSSGHTSSLSPSPRATQSPPKQTLFSPCVDVFEPGPPRWEDGEERRDEEDNVDDDDDDMGADESQYRHRRLTGDSGIEVCRCRVVEEEEEEEEEERKEDSRRRVGKERDKNGGVNPDLHDSVDCPARGQTTTGEELCNPTSTTTPTSEDKFVVVMETV